MDSKKRLKRTVRSDVAEVDNKTPQKTATENKEATASDFMDVCGSPDFPSSQECFSVGWDWSGQLRNSNKPTIRVVERPVRKRNEGVELLECRRPRRLVRKYDPDMFDASSFVDELKSLASDFKRVPESSSPVASPPHSSFRRRGDLLVTPTVLKIPPKGSSSSLSAESVETLASVASTPLTINSRDNEGGKDNLNDLLDDSLGADLLKFTQDIEKDFKQNESKTPKNPQAHGSHLSSSRKKSRLSLSCKKGSKDLRRGVCRRINDTYEEDHVPSYLSKPCESGNAATFEFKEKKEDNQNNNVSPNIEFDDLDEATLLTITELEEKELTKSGEACSSKGKSGNPCTVPVQLESNGNNLHPENIGEDDADFVSPDILDMIDLWERKATQDGNAVSNQKQQSESESSLNEKPTSHVPPVKDEISRPQGDKSSKRQEEEKKFEIDKNQASTRKKTLSLGGGGFKCTPEEIEKKRQDAIRKRLQLKKKPH